MSDDNLSLLATALRNSRPYTEGTVGIYFTDTRVKQWEDDVNACADFCAQCTPMFDREKFNRDCGLV